MSRRQQLRAAVVGCGRIGSLFSEQARTPGIHSHAEAYVRHPRTQLVAVCDSDPRQLARAARRWGATPYRDLQELMAVTRPDVVSVCTPDALHAAHVGDILRQGIVRGLLVEKPLALTAGDGARLVAGCCKAEVALAVNHTRRFSPAFQLLRNEFARGKCGALVLARFVYGKGLLHNGTHALDLLRFLLGDPLRARLLSQRQDRGCFPGHDVELTYAAGGRALLTSFPETTATVFEADFMFEKSRWRFELGGTRWTFYKRSSALYQGYTNYVETSRKDPRGLFTHPLRDCLFNAVDNLVGHLDRGTPLVCRGEDGVAVLRQVESLIGQP